MSTTVRLDVRDRVAWITLDGPTARNALDQESASHLVAACDTVDRESAIGAVVLTGAGAAFCVADLLGWCPDLAPLGLSAAVRQALKDAYVGGPPTYDLAPAGAPVASMDQFNERVLEGLRSSLRTRTRP